MEGKEAKNTAAASSSPLFSFSNSNASFGFGFGFGASSRPPPPPPPPAVEVLLSEESPVVAGELEPVVIDDYLSIYKGRASTSDVFGVKNSDLVPGKYEGGLKLWEGSLDLVKTLDSDIKEDRLLVEGKRVLELGCGHGLPGIYAGLKGAGLVHFQDFNAEVLRCLTVPNVKANLLKESSQEKFTSGSVGFFAGDWSEIDNLLLRGDADLDKSTNSNENDKVYNGYDIILMAETVYAVSSLPSLYRLIKKCLRYPEGIVYMASKKHYFGVGGGTRQFVRLVKEDGAMQSDLLAEVADGSSNVREESSIDGRAASFFHYQRLECRDDDGPPRPSKRRWLPALDGKPAATPCFFHVKKLKWSRITSVLLPRKVVAELSSKIRRARAMTMEGATDICPTIIFASQWGLPVLSRPLLAGKKARYLHHGKGF
uniref:protein-histidine N-methyltransferase n=1 Tax=Oryza punctata TaxID=4537 RepID=A0A0E0M0B2_ORYPU